MYHAYISQRWYDNYKMNLYVPANNFIYLFLLINPNFFLFQFINSTVGCSDLYR